MVDVTAIAEMITSLKTAAEIAKALKDLRGGKAVDPKVLEFNAKMLDALRSAITVQEERAALVERIRELEQELAGLEKWDCEKAKYQLKAVDTGCLAYVAKGDADSAEPEHWLCANCFSDRKKSFLQHQGQTENFNHSIYGCARCSGRIMTATAHPGGE
jgi:hypothetical protein